MEGTFYETAMNAAQEELVEEEIPEEAEPVEEEELTLETQSILDLGHLKGSTRVGNHEITFRTLTIGEELQSALLAQPYKNTIEEPRALMAALLSAAIVTVDGHDLQGITLGKAEETPEARLKTILSWHWPVIMKVYADYAKLTDQVFEQYNEVKKD